MSSVEREADRRKMVRKDKKRRGKGGGGGGVG